MLDFLGQRLAVDKVHDVIDSAVFFKEVMHPHNMLIVQVAQAYGLFLELFLLAFVGIVIVGHTDSDVVAVTHVDATHIELFHGIELIEGHVAHQIGVAEASRGQLLLNAIGTASEQNALSQHSAYIHNEDLLFGFHVGIDGLHIVKVLQTLYHLVDGFTLLRCHVLQVVGDAGELGAGYLEAVGL